MIAVFTCNVCETRSMKKFSKQAYETGVVVVQCPNCKSYHLLADRLGVFEEDFDITKVIGQKVNLVDDNVLGSIDPETLRKLIEPS